MTSTDTENQEPSGIDRGPNKPSPVTQESQGRWLSKTLVNFWVDASLLIVFLVLLWVTVVLYFLFPPGRAYENLTLWGGTAEYWRGFQFWVFCVFAVDILLHVMLHWTWVCSVVSKHILHQKPTRDDGIQTIIGVGVLIAIIHIIAAALFAAWLGMDSPNL